MCSTGVTIYAIDVSLESSLGLVPAAHAVDASLEPSQVLVVTSTPSSKAKRHAIDAKREAKSSDAAGRTMSLPDAPGREVYHINPTERLVRRGIRRADGFVRPRGARVEMCCECAAAQGMGPEVEAAVQVAPRFDGLDGRVLVYFKLAGAALLHQSEHAAPLERE